jgi:alpha-mannosidase
VWVEGDASIEALKKAEKEEALVVRVVETRGRRASAVLKTTLEGASIAETDLMEWKDGDFRAFKGELAFGLFPFEIKTFKIRNVRN